MVNDFSNTTLVTKSGVEWLYAIVTLNEEINFGDDPGPLMDLVRVIISLVPEGAEEDSETIYGDIPLYTINLPFEQAALLNEVLTVPE